MLYIIAKYSSIIIKINLKGETNEKSDARCLNIESNMKALL